MPFIVRGQNIDFSKNVKEQIASAPPVATQKTVEKVAEEKRANISSIKELFEKTVDQKLKEAAAARPIVTKQDITVTRSSAPQEKKIDGHEVHKDITLVRNKNKLAKRSQYLNDLLTFENK